MKKQVVVIHGGDTFVAYNEYLDYLTRYEIDFERYRLDARDWKENVAQMLGDSYEVIRPEMPNKRNAHYKEWKIWFEKFIPFLNDEVILVGHSMGGAFLTKYLSENKFPKKIKAVFLVAAVFDDSEGYPLASFSLPKNLDLQTNTIFLYHSKDDNVVPFASLVKFKSVFTSAIVREFVDRGHFNQSEFPEVVEDINALNN